MRTFYAQRNTIGENSTSTNQTNNNDSIPFIWETETYAYIYGAIMLFLFCIALARSIVTFHLGASASQHLHDNMFKGLISTTMRFFDLNSSGRILNRFSKDMGSADEALPKSFLDAAQINLSMIGAILVTVFVNLKFGAVILIMFILFILMRNIYLKSSTNIKRFEGISMFEQLELNCFPLNIHRLIYIYSEITCLHTHFINTEWFVDYSSFESRRNTTK